MIEGSVPYLHYELLIMFDSFAARPKRIHWEYDGMIRRLITNFESGDIKLLQVVLLMETAFLYVGSVFAKF